MADFPGLSGPMNTPAGDDGGYTATPTAEAPMIMAPQYNDKYLLDMFDRYRRESTEYRWIWEREWLRDLYYVANRQWITYHPTRREWVDKRLQKWIPKPITPKVAETLSTIRTNMAAINLGIVARPINHDSQSIATAQIADQMSPLIQEEHMMQQVMREADFWLIATGNSCLQLSWDNDVRFNRSFIQHEQCLACGMTFPPQDILAAGNVCPHCGANQFMPATNPQDQKPIGDWIASGKGKTTALSPFEWAVPPDVTRFDDLPYIIRMRWRDKHWFEANRPELMGKIAFEKTPTDRSLALFKSLALTNDVGSGSQFSFMGAAGNHTVEGITEYELWLKPTKEFPKGFVMRVLGEKQPVLLHSEAEEGLPGPIPFQDIEGNPLFPFVHAQYEHMGGRLYGRSALSPIIQKQDQLNQLDSLIQLIVQRMANPVWIVPEGAGIDHFTGEPGLVMKWNPLAAGGNANAKPDRVAGSEVPASLYQLRQQYLDEIEALSGTYDIIKGQKPSGDTAFSALQLLVERGQSRFASAYQSRGEMFRSWFQIAIELERQFGPQQRVLSVLGPNKGYTFKHFQNAQLQGQVNFIVEDGSNMPKTSLGKRAAIEQANNLALLNPADPDQRYALLQTFGLADLVPTLSFHVQAALQIQDAFERWIEAPIGPSPLVIKRWFDLQIHWSERIKWLNTDRMRDLLAQRPEVEMIIDIHLQQLQMMMAPPVQVGPDGEPIDQTGQSGQAPGGGQAMAQSNRESGSTADVPRGAAQQPNTSKGQQGPA